jgi:hypothetical protein
MEIWQHLLPTKVLVKSERTARTPRGQLGFRAESARIRWGSVKSSMDGRAGHRLLIISETALTAKLSALSNSGDSCSNPPTYASL